MIKRIWRNPIDKRPLDEQLFETLSREIRTGVFPVGTVIPSVRRTALSFGVSHVVAWRALKRLADEGLVAAKASAGSVVLPRTGRSWQGRVLMVERDSAGSYYAAILADQIARGLMDAGYILEREVLSRDVKGNYDFSRVELKLGDPVRLVLQMHEDVRISRYLVRHKVPIVCVARSRTRVPGAVGIIRSNHLSSAAAFAKACRDNGLRSVWQIGGWSHAEETAILKKEGLDVRELVFTPREDAFELEDTQRAALKGVEGLFKRGLPKWPDVLRFTDDFTATGFLQGLLLHGVRVPEDVRVVSLSNRGFGPVFHKTLAREEMDPFAHGQAVAAYVTAYLKTGRLPPPLTLDAVFLPGKTFP